MDKVLRVNVGQSLEDTLDDIGALLKLHESVVAGCLVRVDIAFVAELHDDEDPPFVCNRSRVTLKGS